MRKETKCTFQKEYPPTNVCISIIFNFSWNHCHTFEKQKTKVIQRFFLGGGGKQGVLWEMRKWRIGESRRGENGYERRSTTGRGTRDAKRESRRRRGVTFDSVLFYDRELTGTFSQAMFGQNESLEKLSITFTSNGKRECVPRDQVSSLLVVYCSLFLHLN